MANIMAEVFGKRPNGSRFLCWGWVPNEEIARIAFARQFPDCVLLGIDVLSRDSLPPVLECDAVLYVEKTN